MFCIVIGYLIYIRQLQITAFEVTKSLSLQVQRLLRQKQLEIEDFSVYWDTECEVLGKLPPDQIQVRHYNSVSI